MREHWQFALTVLKSFRANQGLLLAGALAYYSLLSIVPLFTLLLVVLSHVVPQHDLMATLDELLKLVVPGQSAAVVNQVTLFLRERDVVSWLVASSLLFFSSIAFGVLENAMSVIFFHRMRVQRRHFLMSAILPYLYILVLGVGFLVMTVLTAGLQAMESRSLALFGAELPLGGFAHAVVYLIGLVAQILIFASIYVVMPVGRLAWQEAFIGATAAGLVWEITRRVLVWYFSSLSFVSVVYGSLATVIFVLLGLEAAAVILLLGAQVIAEYERRQGIMDDTPLP